MIARHDVPVLDAPGEPGDRIGAFAGPAFDADAIEAHLAAWTIRRVAEC